MSGTGNARGAGEATATMNGDQPRAEGTVSRSGQIPAVSVGIPVFNGERYLQQAIDVVRAQTFQNIEIIICDNASSDGTREICERAAAADARIRYLRHPRNLGAAANFNACLALARAPLFKWACADDLSDPRLIERCVAELAAAPECVMAYPQTRLIDESGRPIGEPEEGLDLRDQDVVRRFQLACDKRGLLNALDGVIRTETLRSTRGFGNYPGADIVLMIELAVRGTFHEIPERLQFRRMHENAASAGKTLAERQEHLDPQTKGERSTWYWRHKNEQIRVALKAPTEIWNRLQMVLDVLHTSWWHRRELWRELIRR